MGSAPSSLQLLAPQYSATPQPSASSEVNPAQVVAQISHAVQTTYRGGQEMQFQLNPPDLGAVRVDVAVHNGVLSARLEVQSPTTQQMLTDNLSQLKDSLAQQGVSFDRIDVHLAGTNVNSGGSSGTGPSFGQQGESTWDQQRAFAFTETDDAHNVPPAPRAPVSRVSQTSLDITV